MPSDDSKTKSRLALIRAHRHYLETLYHKPLDFTTNKLPELVETMNHVLRLADGYGSLAIFQMPVETVFRRLKWDLDRSCGRYYYDIICIATLARSAWLFQYVICCLVGDPTWTDDRISKKLEKSGVVPLVLQKRSQLRESMLQIDQDIMRANVPVFGECSDEWGRATALATAAYQHHLLDHLEKHDRVGWGLSSEKYRVLKDQGESWPTRRSDKLLSRCGYITANKVWSRTVLDCLRKKVANHVSPLLVDHVDRDITLLSTENLERTKHGLTCVKITNDDLPWKDIPW